MTVGRQTPYKKTHLIVEACKKLNVPLAVLGDGPDHKILKKIAGPLTTFICPASDTDIEQALPNVNNKTGMFFDKQTVDSLAETLQKFNLNKYDQKDLVAQASRFGKENFKDSLIKFVENICVE